jgi:PAS domain S-box-containing protein
MQCVNIQETEIRRLRRLHRLGLLDTEAESVLDNFTQLAARLTDLPIALISLIDSDRQWFKSAIGLPQGAQTPREIAFCHHAICSDEFFEVEDARQDPRFADNPLVRGEPKIAHYAGSPLVMPGGERIGTLCVIGDKPGRLDARTRDLLVALSRGIVSVLLLRESERDLGARVRAERALQESEARFQTIANAMPQMVWSTTAQGVHDYFNKRWYDFTGLPEGSSDTAAWIAVHHPDDRAHTEQAWRHSLAHGEPYELETRLRHHSGEYRWALNRALPARGEQGEILRWMGTCTDIQDQKRAQEELLESNRRKDEFLAMLAHELRNPLAPISTAAHLLRMAPADPQRVLRASELIGRQVAHMTELVDDLLDVSRVTRGLVRIEHETVDLHQVVHDALEQTRPQIEARRHEVVLELTPAPVRVDGDRVRLVQVLANLLGNAAKYTPEGGRIQVRLRCEGGQGALEVQDNGSGIDADLMPHVFDLFTQAKRTPDRAQGGLGVGLALVKSLVDLHGGQVRARSPGRGLGSTFTVCLPLTLAEDLQTSQPSPLQAPEPALSPPAGVRPLRVLVVDDNVDAGESLGAWLQAEGHAVTVKTDAVEALQEARRAPADVYVLDIGLPGMDGNALARHLREDPRNRQAMLIALTGYGQAQDILRSREAGFDHHFVKPADPQRLEAVLGAVGAVSA